VAWGGRCCPSASGSLPVLALCSALLDPTFGREGQAGRPRGSESVRADGKEGRAGRGPCGSSRVAVGFWFLRFPPQTR
jgi:hypothetical protein